MRFRFRYKAGWTAFIFIFALAGVILTFRQWRENKESKQWNENKENKRYNNFLPRDGIGVDRKPAIDDLNHQPDVHMLGVIDTHHGEQEVVQRLPKQMALNLDQSVVNRLKNLVHDLYPADWGQAKDADEMALDVKTELLDLGFESPLTCKEIDDLRISSSLKVGRKKYVDRAYMNDHHTEVVLKSQAVDQNIKLKCMQKFYDADKCHVMGNYLLIREIVLMSILKHPSIINLLGYCLRGDNINYEIKKKGIVLVTEPGRSIDLNMLGVQVWKERLMFAIQLAELLNYLEHSPLGSLELDGIRADDFVVVNKRIKLSDLDDLRIEEPRCQSSDQCLIPGATNYKISCELGRCKNRNAKANLQRLGPTVFDKLLRYPPNDLSDKMGKLRQNIITLEITAEELIQKLKSFTAGDDMNEELPVKPVNPLPVPTGQPRAKVEFVGQSVHDKDDLDEIRRQEEIRQNRVLPEVDKNVNQQQDNVVGMRQEEAKVSNTASGDFIRVDQHNFPGMFDYTCQNSRVVWGCVITVRSLQQAKEICTADTQCQSFVLFTSNPDLDVLMTMVAKNSAAAKPEPNVGATLFIKSSTSQRGGGVPVISDPTPAPKKVVSYQDCYKRMLNVTSEARISRERRLMAHLGLKGLQDEGWRKKVQTLTIASHKGQNALMSGTTIGGRYNVQFRGGKSDKRFANAIFIAEIGPVNYHIAHMIVYGLDRLLGLYHTPPTVLRTLTKEELEAVQGDSGWLQQLHGVQPADGSVKGLLSAYMPHVIKQESLSISKLDKMVDHVVQFSRLERMQLEYVFLLWITKSFVPNDKHWGYKGHLIHFGADQAFQDHKQNMIGYFYHCQFPNIVYKALMCFKCHGNTGQHTSSMCSLGQEVIKQVLQEGFLQSDIVIYSLKENEISITINEAASTAFSVVEQCIKTFGRDKVLY